MRQPARRLASLTALIVLFASGTAFAQAPPAQGEPSKEAIEEARTHYERGAQLYNEGSFDLALIEFQRAYELARSYKLLYNIAQVQAQLSNFAGALQTFEKYIAEGGKDIAPKRRAEVEKEMASLKTRTAQLEIITNVEGVEIAIDDTVIGKTPFQAPVIVNAGRRTITASKPGRVSAKRQLTLAGQDDLKVEFELPEAPPPQTSTGPAVRERTIIQTVPERSPSYVWVGWTATGALTAAAVVVGVIALNKQQALRNAVNSVTTLQDLQDAQSSARTFSITTDVLIGAAVVTGAVSFYFTVKGSGSNTKKSSASAYQLRVAPRGVQLAGAF